MSTVSLKWITSQLMVGVDSFGHPLVIGSWPEASPEWAGLKPSDLLLLGVASCSAYDVVTILRKQRQPLQGLEIQVQGEQQATPPYAFTHIRLLYRLYGNLDREKAERAVRLSEEKYCSVINSLSPAIQLEHQIEILAGGRE